MKFRKARSTGKRTLIAVSVAALVVPVASAEAASTTRKFGCTVHVHAPAYRWATVDGARQKVDVHVVADLSCNSTHRIRFLDDYLMRNKSHGADSPVGKGGYKHNFVAKAGKTYHVTARKRCSGVRRLYYGIAAFNIHGFHASANVRSSDRYMYCDAPIDTNIPLPGDPPPAVTIPGQPST